MVAVGPVDSPGVGGSVGSGGEPESVGPDLGSGVGVAVGLGVGSG